MESPRSPEPDEPIIYDDFAIDAERGPEPDTDNPEADVIDISFDPSIVAVNGTSGVIRNWRIGRLNRKALRLVKDVAFYDALQDSVADSLHKEAKAKTPWRKPLPATTRKQRLVEKAIAKKQDDLSLDQDKFKNAQATLGPNPGNIARYRTFRANRRGGKRIKREANRAYEAGEISATAARNRQLSRVTTKAIAEQPHYRRLRERADRTQLDVASAALLEGQKSQTKLQKTKRKLIKLTGAPELHPVTEAPRAPTAAPNIPDMTLRRPAQTQENEPAPAIGDEKAKERFLNLSHIEELRSRIREKVNSGVDAQRKVAFASLKPFNDLKARIETIKATAPEMVAQYYGIPVEDFKKGRVPVSKTIHQQLMRLLELPDREFEILIRPKPTRKERDAPGSSRLDRQNPEATIRGWEPAFEASKVVPLYDDISDEITFRAHEKKDARGISRLPDQEHYDIQRDVEESFMDEYLEAQAVLLGHSVIPGYVKSALRRQLDAIFTAKTGKTKFRDGNIVDEDRFVDLDGQDNFEAVPSAVRRAKEQAQGYESRNQYAKRILQERRGSDWKKSDDELGPQTELARYLERFEDKLDPSQVLELFRSWKTEMGRHFDREKTRVEAAGGEFTGIGGLKERFAKTIEPDVIEKLLSNYFGVSIDDLRAGEIVPYFIQDRVLYLLLDISPEDLRALASGEDEPDLDSE